MKQQHFDSTYIFWPKMTNLDVSQRVQRDVETVGQTRNIKPELLHELLEMQDKKIYHKIASLDSHLLYSMIPHAKTTSYILGNRCSLSLPLPSHRRMSGKQLICRSVFSCGNRGRFWKHTVFRVRCRGVHPPRRCTAFVAVFSH